MLLRTIRIPDFEDPRFAIDPDGEIKEITFYVPETMSEADLKEFHGKATKLLKEKGLIK